MNELQIFNNERFRKIRALELNGEPWFCLADVCKPLGLRSYHCKERLKPDGIVTNEVVDNAGRKNRMLFVNEGNLYRAIFQSKKPEAEAFTDWVTEEVLPTLRRSGRYSIAPAPRTPALPDGVTFSSAVGFMRLARRVMLDMGSTPVQVGMMMKETLETCGFPVPASFSKQIEGQLSLFDPPALEG